MRKKKEQNPIELFFHCNGCLNHGRRGLYAIGLDHDGVVVVWCETCDRLVGRLDPATINGARHGGCQRCGGTGEAS